MKSTADSFELILDQIMATQERHDMAMRTFSDQLKFLSDKNDKFQKEISRIKRYSEINRLELVKLEPYADSHKQCKRLCSKLWPLTDLNIVFFRLIVPVIISLSTTVIAWFLVIFVLF